MNRHTIKKQSRGWKNHGARGGQCHVINQCESIPNPHTEMTLLKADKGLGSVI